MGNMQDNKRGIETALDILVGKWKPVILHHIFSKELFQKTSKSTTRKAPDNHDLEVELII